MAYVFLPDHGAGEGVTQAQHVASVRSQLADQFDHHSNVTLFNSHTIVNLESGSPKTVQKLHDNIPNPYRNDATASPGQTSMVPNK